MRTGRSRIAICAAMLPVGAACGNGEPSEQTPQALAGQQSQAPEIKQACEVFTLEMARQLLGDTAKKSEAAAQFAGSSNDIAGSACTYEAENPEAKNKFAKTITASLTLKTAITDKGKRSNQWTFEQAKAAFEEAGEQTETVADMNAAYYIGGFTNQLHALVREGEHELIASAQQPDGDNRAATEKLAKRAIDAL